MKKKLVVLLAVVMMFAFSASAYAVTFSDVSDRPIVEQDAIKKAVALGIINGYEDGTFGPEKTITRAEFAKIAVTAAGAEQTATMLQGNKSSFSDVRDNSWYTGWINAAQSLGIMQGSNGAFRPNDNISNQEVITVMLRLLGYNDNLTGNWPANYVTKANQLNILDDVEIVAAAPAKRGDVVVMLGETLDTSIVTYDKDTNEFVLKQTEITTSRGITLLEDSFDGSFVKVEDTNTFLPITQVRDANAKTLNWSVTGILKGSSTTEVMIIDDQTAVSYNTEGLFDLEGHQGKVYFVENGGRKYVRFIEVESYTKTTTDDVVYTKATNRFSILKTNLNTAPSVRVMNGYGIYDTVTPAFTAPTQTTWTVAQTTGNVADAGDPLKANSNIILFYNDDDQVYMIAVDRDFDEKAYMVKTVNTNNVRLIGESNKTVSMNDSDTLIWDGDKFIAPSDLEVGDAIIEITPSELYVKTNTISGELASTDRINATTNVDYRFKVAGKNYVTYNAVTFLDEELEDSGVSVEDVIGNNVIILLNKDNSIAAFMIDETSIGATMYGIVTSGGSTNGDWVTGDLSSLTIYTQDAQTITYDLDEDFAYDVTEILAGGPVTNVPDTTKVNIPAGLNPETLLGSLVAFKLDKNGEINDLKVVGQSGAVAIDPDSVATGSDLGVTGGTLYGPADDGDEVKVKNNAYITFGGNSFALAPNAVIFEVGEKAASAGYNKVDANLITRSNMLSKGDFEPERITVGNYYDTFSSASGQSSHLQYVVYDLNSSGAVKAMAFTTATSNDLNYGVIASWDFRGSDYTHSVTLKGDDNVYELKAFNGGAGQLIIYRLNGNKLTPVYNYSKKGGNLLAKTQEVTGVTSGLLTFANPVCVEYSYDEGANHVYRNNVMTDANTVVYVIDATDGTFSEGSLSDVSRGDWAYVPVVDKDGYADIVIVDEYTVNNTIGGVAAGPYKYIGTYYVRGDRAEINTSGITATQKYAGTTVTLEIKGYDTVADYDVEVYVNYDYENNVVTRPAIVVDNSTAPAVDDVRTVTVPAVNAGDVVELRITKN